MSTFPYRSPTKRGGNDDDNIRVWEFLLFIFRPTLQVPSPNMGNELLPLRILELRQNMRERFSGDFANGCDTKNVGVRK